MIKRSIHGEYVSILKRPQTQPSNDRWGFEMTSRKRRRLVIVIHMILGSIETGDIDVEAPDI